MTDSGSAYPPDVTVPMRDAPGAVTAAKSAGTGAADDYAAGLRLAQRGDLTAARQAWDRAAFRGSPEAMYALGLMCAADGDDAGFREAVRCADAGGSMLAAAASVGLAQADGDPTGAQAALIRLRERAERADLAGSADAAILLAQVAEQEGDQVAALAAWRRADSRGAVTGTLGLVQILLQGGDLHSAEAAARRAEDAGVPAASYLLAAVYLRQRRSREAYAATLRAIEAAGSTGDGVTLRLATQLLRPYGLGWWRSHRLLAIALVAALVVVGVWAGWRWPVAISALLVVFAFSQRPIVPGMPQVMPEAEQGLALAGIGASATLGGPDPLGSRREPGPTRVATRRDYKYWCTTVTFLALTAAVSLGWAAGLFAGDAMVRVLFGALAVLTLVFFAWQWPHIGAADRGSSPASETDDRLTIRLTFAPGLFWSMHLTFFVTNPLLKGLVERSRRRAERAPRSRRMVRLQWAAPALIAAAVLAALAAAPNQRQVVDDTAGLVGMAIEAIIIVYGLSRAWKQGRRAIGNLDLLGLIAALGYVLVLAALVLVAYRLGLFDPWRALFA
jgi:tetratricopeptide (TPR) repeat protein